MNFFRRHLDSKITKVIALIIALIFISWEFISSMLQQKNTWLIKVGEIEYNAKDWQEHYKSLTSDPLSAQEAIANPQYAKKRVLDDMVRNALVLQAAQEIGFIVNDKMAASEIIHMKMFQKEGKFDSGKLEKILKNNNMTEQEFIKNMKENIMRNQLMDVFYNTSGIIGTPTYNLLLKLLTAEQNITLYNIPILNEKVAYSDSDLEAFIDENKDKFTSSDEANISTVLFTKDIVNSDDLAVSQGDIEDFYKQNLIVEPEKRSVNQIVIPNYNEARDLLKRINSGKITYDQAAKLYIDRQMIPYEIGPFVSEEFDQNIADVVFKLPINGISTLVETPLGWHIFRVSKIYEAKTKNLGEVKDSVRQKLLDKKFTDKMHEIVKDVMESIENKATIGQIAEKYNLKIEEKIEKARKLADGTIDINSIDSNSEENGIAKRKIVAAAFANEDNKIKLISGKNNRSFIIMETNDITPGKVMNLEDIRATVVDQYLFSRADLAARKIAEDYRTKLVNNEQFDKPQYKEVRLSRIRENDEIPQCINTLLANMNKNGIFEGITIPCRQDTNYFFAEMKNIDFSVEVSDYEKEGLRQGILSLYNEIIFNQFLDGLKKRYKVELDEQFVKYLNDVN
jgi:peptidyl-prolyl cis-trans isomerase D